MIRGHSEGDIYSSIDASSFGDLCGYLYDVYLDVDVIRLSYVLGICMWIYERCIVVCMDICGGYYDCL